MRILLLILTILATPAFASDGALEINQTCAVETGCFPGDSAGFPVTIDERGSYRLTSNLSVSGANTTAVEVTTNDVVFDLAGFAIAGPGGTGTGDGINQAGFLNRVTVKNGTIRGMGDDGVELGREARVLDLTVFDSGDRGIAVSNGGLIRGNTVRSSGSNGIDVGGPSLVQGNVVYQNGADGIFASSGSIVVDNVVGSSTGLGLNAGGPVGFARNALRFNNGSGDQTNASAVPLGENLCQTNTTCP